MKLFRCDLFAFVYILNQFGRNAGMEFYDIVACKYCKNNFNCFEQALNH